jgi:hypothetical protein
MPNEYSFEMPPDIADLEDTEKAFFVREAMKHLLATEKIVPITKNTAHDFMIEAIRIQEVVHDGVLVRRVDVVNHNSRHERKFRSVKI